MQRGLMSILYINAKVFPGMDRGSDSFPFTSSWNGNSSRHQKWHSMKIPKGKNRFLIIVNFGFTVEAPMRTRRYLKLDTITHKIKHCAVINPWGNGELSNPPCFKIQTFVYELSFYSLLCLAKSNIVILDTRSHLEPGADSLRRSGYS